MAHIHFDYSKVAPFVNEHELGYMQSQVTAAHNELREGTGCRKRLPRLDRFTNEL
jgi:glucose-6-phosphate isomerase